MRNFFNVGPISIYMGEVAVRPKRVSTQCLPAEGAEARQPLSTAKFTPEQVACFEEKFRHFQSAQFRFWVGERDRAQLIHSVNDLLANRHALDVFDSLFLEMDAPRLGLRFLLGSIAHLSNSNPIDLYFPNTTHKQFDGLYEKIGAITVYEPNIATLYHELGHKLMHLSYQMDFPIHEGTGHDDSPLELTHKTSLSAAWTEGFADFMQFIDGEFDANDPPRLHFYLSKVFTDKPLNDKLKNEWVIARVLQAFCERHIPTSEMTFDDSIDLGKVKNLFETIRTAGIQNDFGEFLVDYVYLYPQDKPALTAALRGCGLLTTDTDENTLFSAPNYKERLIAKFIAHYESFSEWSPILPNAARAKAWAILKEKGLIAKLTYPAYSVDDRFATMTELKKRIEQQAKQSIQINSDF